MRARPRVHLPTIRGRLRSDPGPLLLMGIVVAVTTALTSATTPLMARTSDRALADVVSKAGDQSALVATFARTGPDYGPRTRDPRAAAELRDAATGAHYELPKPVASVLQPGIISVTSSPLQLLDAGPDRYLTLVYVDGPTGAPRVRYTSGGPPRATGGAAHGKAVLPADAPPWPVQVAVSQSAASALGLEPGDRLTAADALGRPVAARVSGIFVARDPDDREWATAPQLLHPAQGVAAGHPTAAAAALVSSAALPDLELAVPSADLTARVVAMPRPESLHWANSAALVRALVSVKASPDVASDNVSWDTTLDRVLIDGRAQIAAARGQADVLLVSLLMCALLVLWQAADLVVRRRARSVVLTRERGGTLAEIGSELFVEAVVCALTGAVLGLLFVRIVVGEVGGGRWALLPLLAAVAAAATGAHLASRATDPRRTPANRTARRWAARRRLLQRALLVTAVIASAALSYVVLRQRGVLGVDGARGGSTAVTAPTWWAVAGALLVLAALPLLTAALLNATRGTSGGVVFFVAARVRESGMRALPLLVVTVTVAQLVFALTLMSTEQRGQAAGALSSVGGDARATLTPGASATELAARVAAMPGVRATVAARVEDEVPATSRERAAAVRLVVVSPAAYEHLLSVSALPDAPQLGELAGGRGNGVPALLLGGDPGLRDGLAILGSGRRTIPLRVVGTAPRVGDTVDPVVVVDAETFARSGGAATPNTVWAVGPGAATALRTAVGSAGTVVVYADTLAARRAAPLAAGLVRLAVSSAVLLLLFAVLSVAMAAASEAEPRAESLGRLRSLGLRDGQLWGLLAGELLLPALLGLLAGLVLGLSAAMAMLGQLSLERITGQVSPPDVSIPPWTVLSGVVLVVTVLVLTHTEWLRLRRVALGELLRGGPPR